MTLLDLPPEILDGILRYVIPFPNQHYHSVDPHISIADAFMAPIAQISHDIRRHSLELIRRSCLWMCFRVVSVEERDWASPDYGCTKSSPEICIIPRMLLPEKTLGPNIFNIRIEENSRDEGRIAEHVNLKVVYFPYNFDSFSRLCMRIRHAAIIGRIRRMEIEYTTEDQPKATHIHHHIMSSIFTIRGLHSVTFQVPSSLKPPSEHTEAMLWKSVGAKQLLEDAERALWFADQCELYDFEAEAGLSLVYNTWIADKAQHHLPYPEHWELGEDPTDAMLPVTEHDTANWDGWKEDPNPEGHGRNEVSNKLRAAVHSVEYRACIAFYNLYCRFGLDWLFTHILTSGLMEGRWMRRLPHMCFGYSTSELAQVHHAKSLSLFLYKLIEPLSSYPIDSWSSRAWKRLRKRGLSTVEDMRQEAFENVWEIDEMEEIEIALWLEPDNPLFMTTFHEIKPEVGDGRVYPNPWFLRQRFKQVSSTRFGGWKGDKCMLEAWGGEEMLLHYPLARKGLLDGDD